LQPTARKSDSKGPFILLSSRKEELGDCLLVVESKKKQDKQKQILEICGNVSEKTVSWLQKEQNCDLYAFSFHKIVRKYATPQIMSRHQMRSWEAIDFHVLVKAKKKKGCVFLHSFL
jgi:hypothetical protein